MQSEGCLPLLDFIIIFICNYESDFCRVYIYTLFSCAMHAVDFLVWLIVFFEVMYTCTCTCKKAT